MPRFDPSKWETVIDDATLEKAVDKVRKRFGYPATADVTYVTFIQPARNVDVHTEGGIVVSKGVPEMAVFAALSDRPNARRKGQQIMTSATVSLADWIETEREAGHYAAYPDKASEILGIATARHLQILRSARELIVN